jgi:hypothetical protein
MSKSSSTTSWRSLEWTTGSFEIWVNLDQPYAHKAGRPCRCRRSDFVVVSHSPTHLLVHLLNADLDLWLSSAHAPHSGTALHEREEWWHQLTETVHS